jgi:hypothetical protein
MTATLAVIDADHETEEEINARIQKMDRFSRCYIRYVRALADLDDPDQDDSDEAMEKKDDEADDALWHLIRLQAPVPSQAMIKIGIFRKLLKDEWWDRRTRALFESIVSDCDRLGKLHLDE